MPLLTERERERGGKRFLLLLNEDSITPFFGKKKYGRKGREHKMAKPLFGAGRCRNLIYST